MEKGTRGGCGLKKHPALTYRLDVPFRVSRVYVTGRPENQNGISGKQELGSTTRQTQGSVGHATGAALGQNQRSQPQPRRRTRGLVLEAGGGGGGNVNTVTTGWIHESHPTAKECPTHSLLFIEYKSRSELFAFAIRSFGGRGHSLAAL